MSTPQIPNAFTYITDQPPPDIAITIADGVFVKAIKIARMGTLIPQHAHVYEHSSVVAMGAIRVWRDGEFLGDFRALTAIVIPACAKHLFQALEDNTVVFCVHNVERSLGAVEIAEEHQIVGDL
jgi:hypothetical protein